MNPIIKQLLDSAIKNNVVAYDKDAKGTYTKNLELIVQKHFSETKDYIEFIIEDPLESMLKYYLEQKCYIPWDKTKIVLFVGQTKCCIGAY